MSTAAARTAAALLRGTGLGAAAIGLLAGETMVAHARIPKTKQPPPVSTGLWRADGVAERDGALRFAVFGDSMAAGIGVRDGADTLAAQLAQGLSAAARRPVQLTNLAVVGSRSAGLRAQLGNLTQAPEVALVLVGANDVTHHVRVGEAVRHLMLAVHALQLRGAHVVVGTCPDLGMVRPIPAPLRRCVHLHSRALAAAQFTAARRAGARPVDLHASLAAAFGTDHRMFSADRYHPSALGYHTAARLVLPALAESLPTVFAVRRAA